MLLQDGDKYKGILALTCPRVRRTLIASVGWSSALDRTTAISSLYRIPSNEVLDSEDYHRYLFLCVPVELPVSGFSPKIEPCSNVLLVQLAISGSLGWTQRPPIIPPSPSSALCNTIRPLLHRLLRGEVAPAGDPPRNAQSRDVVDKCAR